jgi:hypothetical protein
MTDLADQGTRLAVTYARLLRRLGLAVPIGSVLDFGEALGLVGIDGRDSVYWAGRATLVHRPEDIGLYDRAFAVFWERRSGTVEPEPAEPLKITLAIDDGSDDSSDGDQGEASDDPMLQLRFSAAEVLRHKDFAACSDDELADQVRMLRNYGSKVKYRHELPGVNSRIDELQAAFLRVKLAHLDEWNARRKNIAAQYLSQLPSLNPQLILPFVPEWADPVWHLFVVRHPNRDVLQKHLEDSGVQTLIHYPVPAHLSGAYKYLGMSKGTLPLCEALSNELLSFPIGPQMKEVEADYIVKSVALLGS